MIGYTSPFFYTNNYVDMGAKKCAQISDQFNVVRFDLNFMVLEECQTMDEYIKRLGEEKIELAKQVDVIKFRSKSNQDRFLNQVRWLYDACNTEKR